MRSLQERLAELPAKQEAVKVKRAERIARRKALKKAKAEATAKLRKARYDAKRYLNRKVMRALRLKELNAEGEQLFRAWQEALREARAQVREATAQLKRSTENYTASLAQTRREIEAECRGYAAGRELEQRLQAEKEQRKAAASAGRTPDPAKEDRSWEFKQ